jgi:hypothetical protein
MLRASVAEGQWPTSGRGEGRCCLRAAGSCTPAGPGVACLVCDIANERERWNSCRFDAESGGGHYESYFLRANHPTRPLAFWIRYTIFSPKGRPDATVGELWAIHFDGEAGRITAAKEVRPFSECRFSRRGLDARIGEAILTADRLEGQARSGEQRVAWSLGYRNGGAPLLLLPRGYYDRGFPKAKVLVGMPNAVFDGSLIVDGHRTVIEGWVGSQNHNWGSRHTDHYAWGQVAGFDDARDAFLECSTARVRIGPFWSPWLTLVVLRIEGREYALNGLVQGVRARGRFGCFHWEFDTSAGGVRLRGEIDAPATAFVGLRYDNPPGGSKTCLNSKLARCELTLERMGAASRTLVTEHRAAFEILTDDEGHGVPVIA